MANVLIAYGTGEGQTAKISAYIVRDRCHDAELVDEVQRLTEDGGLMLAKLTTTLGAWWAGEIDGFNAFLFALFALMAAGGLPLLVAYLRGVKGVEPGRIFAGHETR